MKFLALLLCTLAAATSGAPSTPVKAASPYYTPPVYSEVSYGHHLPSAGYNHHQHGHAKPGYVFTGYNNQYNGYNNQYNGYNGNQAYQGYNNYHGYNSPYYNNVVLKNN
jgi:hypothetical protein